MARGGRRLSFGVGYFRRHPRALPNSDAYSITHRCRRLSKQFRNRAAGFKSAAQGAPTSAWATVVADANEIGGRYCEDCGVVHLTDDANAMGGVRAWAMDPAGAETLWSRSEELVGERFPL